VTVLADATVTVHCEPATTSHPLQVPTVEFTAAVAVSVTTVPLTYGAAQEVPQLMPAGVLATVPDPVPARTTEARNIGEIVKGKAVESPPPGAGVSTVTCAVPALTTSFAKIVACSWAPPLNVVARLVPFHCTTELGVKLLPVTVRVKPAAPVAMLVGVSVVTEGATGTPEVGSSARKTSLRAEPFISEVNKT